MSAVDGGSTGRVVAERYRLERVLGRGGMGVVWLAVDELIERRVAIKEVRTPAAAVDGEQGSFVQRAMREARSAGRLNHPGVVAVYDVIEPPDGDDAVYIVMEYVPGPTLADILEQQGALPAQRVAQMGLELLDALMAAHAMGIVHRDVKPANVMVGDRDRIKLTDFGIALAAEDTTRLTKSGVIGTHAYLAPECFDTGHAGPPADLWAMGATLFHAVAGRAPFDRATTTETLRAILLEDPPDPPCGQPLADVIGGLLTRPIDQRLTSATARDLLHQATAAPPDDPTTSDHTGQPAWQAQATTVHRAPLTPLPAQPAAASQQPPPFGPPLNPPHPGEPPLPGGPPRSRGGSSRTTAALIAVAVIVVVGLAVGGIVLLGGGDDAESTSGSGDSEGSGAPGGDVTRFCTEGLAIGERWGFSRPDDFNYYSAASAVVPPEDAPEYIADLEALQPPAEIADDFTIVLDLMEYRFSDPETRGDVDDSWSDAAERVVRYTWEHCRPLMDDAG